MTTAAAPVVRRRNPLTGRWVLVCPQRTERPWHGEIDTPTDTRRPAHDPLCHLCPGNRRANGLVNPSYDSVYVFDNDFPALQPDVATPIAAEHELWAVENVEGRCRVICYSPDHHRTMSQLSVAEIRRVVDCWVDETTTLGSRYRAVQIFENRGEMMGCSNPHPHGQIWATTHLPEEWMLEEERQRNYYEQRGRAMLEQVVELEYDGPRQVMANAHWLVIVPWWASWPFETLLVPRMNVARFTQLDPSQRDSLAAILGQLTRRYDALFHCEFPYSMGWHGAPGEDEAPHWRLHAHFYPPLLRSASIRKFMVGYEMLAEPQRDLTPEAAAAKLRDVRPK